MEVIHLNKIEAQENSTSLFTSPVSTKVVEAFKENSPTITYVSFPKGVRNKLHIHNNDQILVVTEGKGIVATESEQKEITVGDIAVIPAGEKHWHGAIEDSAMTHISITAPNTSIDQVEN
jgi:quercetin dioxygenase-like cupin family protein